MITMMARTHFNHQSPAYHNAIAVIITIFMLDGFHVTRCGKSVQPTFDLQLNALLVSLRY